MKYISLRQCIEFSSVAPFIMFVSAKLFLCHAPISFCPWATPFYYAALVALLVITAHVIFRVRFNFFLLATNLWLISSASLFLLNEPYLLHIMNNYKGPFLFASFIVTSIFAVIFPVDAFDSVRGKSQLQNLKGQLLFLTGSILAFIWSIVFNSFGIFFSLIIPFVMLAIFYICLQNFRKQ